ncbi:MULTISPECIES: VOC family protein [Bacillaceae]|uniref:VOC family protein n=1 Tax=Bacillaceae TaxID=186817 RepID=UPI002A1771EF|nr:VOC family protein [Cytobacillus sp. IB215316]MDX8361604.1 VOC family protein [Cytobacillus sp. IB215316]
MSLIKGFHHIALEVQHVNKSIQFYRKLGFEIEKTIIVEDEPITFLIFDQFRLELYENERASSSDDIHFAFEVESIHNIIAWLNENEIKIVEGPLELDNGWQTVFVSGLDGELIEFIQCE